MSTEKPDLRAAALFRRGHGRMRQEGAGMPVAGGAVLPQKMKRPEALRRAGDPADPAIAVLEDAS